MNRIRNYIYTLILIIIIILLFKYSYIINKSVIDGFYLWLYKVFPSLFIMFILNDIIINTNILNNISKSINPLFNRIVAEQVYRSCIDMFVSKVYYMGRVKGKLQKDFVKALRYYGIEVITPLMGYDKKVIPKVLELYR